MKSLIRKFSALKSKLLFSMRSKFWHLLFKECGPGLCVYGRISVRTPELITVGHNCRINEGVLVVGSGPLILGNHVHIGGQVILATSGLDYKKEGWPHFSAQIELKDYVWVGAGARIRPGVTVGEGAIIGMGSVVTHDVLPYTVVAGSPARCISLVEHHLQCTCKQ